MNEIGGVPLFVTIPWLDQLLTVGTASGIQAAIADTSVLDEVAYVCRHRYYSSRRVCWWRPGGYGDRHRHRHWRRRW